MEEQTYMYMYMYLVCRKPHLHAKITLICKVQGKLQATSISYSRLEE